MTAGAETFVESLRPLEQAVQDTLAWASPAAAETAVGASGALITTGAAGVTLFEAADAGQLPTTFAALTVNV